MLWSKCKDTFNSIVDYVSGMRPVDDLQAASSRKMKANEAEQLFNGLHREVYKRNLTRDFRFGDHLAIEQNTDGDNNVLNLWFNSMEDRDCKMITQRFLFSLNYAPEGNDTGYLSVETSGGVRYTVGKPDIYNDDIESSFCKFIDYLCADLLEERQPYYQKQDNIHNEMVALLEGGMASPTS